MFALCMKLMTRTTFLIAKIIVWGVPAFIIPMLILYTHALKAETHVSVPDPLAGHIVVTMPEMITIPVPKKTIRKGSIITQSDLIMEDFNPEQLSPVIAQDMMQMIGQEAKKSLSKHKPIFLRDLGSITIIRRNDNVTMLFQKGTMILQTTGRALEKGGAGDTIKVMNQASKKIISGRITENGDIDVSI